MIDYEPPVSGYVYVIDHKAERARIAFEFFRMKGWTKEQAAGIVGNLQAETGPNLKYEGLVGDRGTAFGLAQWRFDRVKKYENLFGEKLKYASFNNQLEYIHWELTHPESRERQAGAKLKEAKTAAAAAVLVDKHYERSSGHHRKKRVQNAQSLLASFAGVIEAPFRALFDPQPRKKIVRQAARKTFKGNRNWNRRRT